MVFISKLRLSLNKHEGFARAACVFWLGYHYSLPENVAAYHITDESKSWAPKLSIPSYSIVFVCIATAQWAWPGNGCWKTTSPLRRRWCGWCSMLCRRRWEGSIFRMRTAQPGTRQNRNLIRKIDRRDRDESLINQDLNVLSDAFRIRASSSFTISLS